MKNERAADPDRSDGEQNRADVFMTVHRIQFRAKVVLAFIALVGSLPIVPLATAQRATNPNPLAIAFAATPDAAQTSNRVTATVTGAPDDPNAKVLTNISFLPNSTAVLFQNGIAGLRVVWTNPLPNSVSANVWFVAYTSTNRIVFVSSAQLTFPPGGSNAVFQGFSSALPGGNYTVQSFVTSTSGTALSQAINVNMSF